MPTDYNGASQIVRVDPGAPAKQQIIDALQPWVTVLPPEKSTLILLKPNFNSNFSALTGNTTDMRVIAAVVEFLQSHGYGNVVIGDGPAGGFDREGVSVIRRLGADRLAAFYGIKIVDFNNSEESLEVDLIGGHKTRVAKILKQAGFIINLPKVKTHCETGMTTCLKNLVGCCVGIENKRKMHEDLPANIVMLNKAIVPNLHVVDGLIGMEGNGPSRGSPINLGKIIIGTNPFELDYLCARLIDFPTEDVKPLAWAYKAGYITERELQSWKNIEIGDLVKPFRHPKLPLLASIATHKSIQKKLTAIRYAPGIRNICGTKLVKWTFYKLGLSQERIRNEDCDARFSLDRSLCNECGKCQLYCPIGLSPASLSDNDLSKCINCRYCYSVCPGAAIRLDGNLGYFRDEVALYGDIIRRIC